MIDKDQLIAMQNKINKNEMQELDNVKINSNLPIEQKIEIFFEQIKNPYHFTIEGVPFHISFSNHTDKTLQSCIISYFQNKN